MAPPQTAQYAALPADLTELHQWVVWRYEERGGKPTKVPVQPGRSSRASTTNPRTWSSYADACRALVSTEIDGIGFVFSKDDPFCGVDLDDCIAEDDTIHPAALDIVHRLDSYTEISPSGRGLHIICRAEVPEGGPCRTSKTPWGGKFENYDRGRFFCVTGRCL
jgi:putative DNA primase/helicase